MPGVQGKYTIDVTNRFGLAVDEDDQVIFYFLLLFMINFEKFSTLKKSVTFFWKSIDQHSFFLSC